MINAKLKKVFKSTVSLMLVLGLMATTAACDKGGADTDPKEPAQGGEQQEQEAATYTLNEVLTGSPNKWNPHEWETTTDGYIMNYTTMGLYDFALNETRDAYTIIPEMAVGEPEDVTTEYAGDERFNVPEGATSQYAYKVKLNPEACWENGEVINADTYIYSLQQLLNYKMKNYRASGMYEGAAPIANADKYWKQQKDIYTDIYDSEAKEYRDVEDKDMYFSLVNKVAFFGDSAKAYYNNKKYHDYFILEDGTDIFEKYSSKDYNELTEEAKADLLAVSVAFGDNNAEAYKEYCFTLDGKSPAFDWENVGFIKNGEFEVTFVLSKAATPFYFKYSNSSFPLVYKDVYEASKKQTGSIIKSSYGTAQDNYVSYGPYKLVEYQSDKVIKMTKNDKWYGYTDGKHEGQYQTTDVVAQIVGEQATQLQLFCQGLLDDVSLTASDMDNYRTSDYIMYTPQTYTSKISMNSDLNALQSRESDGINKSIQSYRDFRHAISLCFDREGFASKCTATHVPGFGIINHLYTCDPDTGLAYRDTEEAKKVLTTLYKVDNVEDITGYDKVEASKLFVKAYEAALADGNIKETDKIELEFLVYKDDEAYVKMINFLQGCIDSATQGTKVEGKITIKMTADEDYYDHSQTGAFEMIFSTWGGDSMNPFGMMECYCKTEKMFEYGFKPEEEKLTINVDGKELTKTFFEWYDALNNKEYVTAPMKTRLHIMAGIELGLLETYNCPPIYYRTATSLRSKKIEYGTDTYVQLVGFGGVRDITYNYTDKEWEKYCAENDNKLDY